MQPKSVYRDFGCYFSSGIKTFWPESTYTYKQEERVSRLVGLNAKNMRVMVMKISDFQTKDVINIVDGKKLGQVTDLELDLRQGRIDAIIVPTPGKLFGLLGSSADVIIPWKNIVKIGLDVVLVKLDEGRLYRSAEEQESSSSTTYEYNKSYR